MEYKVPAVTMSSLDHLDSADYQRVYEPSDDTFLLADALSADAAMLRGRTPTLCVELGSGSGAVITHLGSLLPPHSTALLATDVNPAAAAATRATGAANAQRVEVGLMDLVSALRPGMVDVLVFNPPYVPTSSEELTEAEGSRDISAAWAGGVRGREVRTDPARHARTIPGPPCAPIRDASRACACAHARVRHVRGASVRLRGTRLVTCTSFALPSSPPPEAAPLGPAGPRSAAADDRRCSVTLGPFLSPRCAQARGWLEVRAC